MSCSHVWGPRFIRQVFNIGRILHPNRCGKHQISYKGCRFFLSDSYRCTEAWQSRLQSSSLQSVEDYLNFTLALREKLDKTGNASPIDMDIMANRMTDLEPFQLDEVEYLLKKFRRSPNGLKLLDSSVYAIVRGYIDLGETEQLLDIIHGKLGYGVFPDPYSTSVLLNYCIKKESYKEAARMAYELMLQEDFSHAPSRLLSLYACVRHAPNFPTRTAEPTEPIEQPAEEEEEDWIPVKWVRRPYYDDHFDIREEQFLLGKTLVMIGQTRSDLIGRSCQLMGFGLYEKFDRGLQLLERLASEASPIVKEALDMFENCLLNAPTRDPDAPEKDLALRAIADEIELLKSTPEEKETYTEKFKTLHQKLAESGVVEEKSLVDAVNTLVTEEIGAHEQADIDAQIALFNQWNEQRETLLQSQVLAILKEEKLKEVHQKLKELQEKEEMLKYFEKEKELELSIWRAPKKKPEPISEADLTSEDTVIKGRRNSRRKAQRKV